MVKNVKKGKKYAIHNIIVTLVLGSAMTTILDVLFSTSPH
jgi:hypothetical protein